MTRALLRSLPAAAALWAACAGAAPAAERVVEIRARKFEYSPNVIRVNRGDQVRIRLLSEDVTHGLYLDGYGLNVIAYPGEDGSLTFTADKTGRFIFRCSVTCGEFHPYMIGHLKVEPNTPFLAYAAVLLALGAGILGAVLLGKAKGGTP
jgi:heme/copper-type cytochrome/quinol oxidase subunit 2